MSQPGLWNAPAAAPQSGRSGRRRWPFAVLLPYQISNPPCRQKAMKFWSSPFLPLNHS
jgi:hypothetical protein